MENKELFNNKTKEQPAQRQPMQLGLYDATNEHDACGVGMLVNIHGSKSHELVESALKVLENMRHRGAEGADNKTGDGAGIMLQIPHEFILLQGIPVPEKGKYGTGLLFLPKDEKDRAAILSIIIEEIEKEGLTLMHLRNVPTCPEILGEAALANEPDIKQIFITGFTDSETADRRLYIIRKRIENKVRRSDIAAREDFYIVSLSTKNIIYKGMLSSLQLRNYFPDLTNNYFTSGLALVHSRFSTNTFPTWGLAQPFRLLAHNGEINTIRGNRGWMEARESVLSSSRPWRHQRTASHHPAEHERQRLAGQRTGVPCHVRPQPTACHGNARTGILQRKEPHQRRPQGLLRIPLYPHGTLGRTCRTTLQRRTLCGWYVGSQRSASRTLPYYAQRHHGSGK